MKERMVEVGRGRTSCARLSSYFLLAQFKAFVSIGRDFGAGAPVNIHSTSIRHEYARFTRHIGA